MTGRAAGLVLAAALVTSGCAVAKLPSVTALQEQTPTQQRLDIMDCKAEAGYRTGYNGDDSPLANVIRHIFVVGTGGAALGGVATGGTTEAVTSDALIAGGSAGGVAGGALGLGGRERFEREWTACMQSRGYAVVATPPAID
jgi:hypothetical protein